MRLGGLLLWTLSLVVAEGDIEDGRNNNTFYEDDNGRLSMLEICEEMINDLVQFAEDEQDFNLTDFVWNDTSCMIYRQNIHCSWSTASLPKDANYSVSTCFCESTKEQNLSCTVDTTREIVECQSSVENSRAMVVQINSTIPGNRYIFRKRLLQGNIEKLDPPKNISTQINSNQLELQWSVPDNIGNYNNDCFDFELKINDNNVLVIRKLAYNKTNIDPTSRFVIQIRTRLNKNCGTSLFWSEWSECVVIEPPKSSNRLTYVIISIVLVLPMILLAVLLVCKSLRVSQKLFPSIPNPKTFFAEENDGQVIAPKHVQCGTEGEEVTVVQVTG